MVSVGPVEVDEISLANLCRRYQVRELALFGSAARGETRADSDIDLLVEFLPEAHIGLMDHAGLMLDLAKLLGRKVDLVSKNGIKPLIRAPVLGEMRLLYAGRERSNRRGTDVQLEG
jgi:predicted nucleotidyltransferase